MEILLIYVICTANFDPYAKAAAAASLTTARNGNVGSKSTLDAMNDSKWIGVHLDMFCAQIEIDSQWCYK